MEDGPLSATRLEIPVDGGSLAAFSLTEADAGDGAAPVVAVHGITSHSRTWVAVARELANAVTLTAVDLRGRGASNALPARMRATRLRFLIGSSSSGRCWSGIRSARTSSRGSPRSILSASAQR
jgi:pimeloyl-ACP methyl ester carboxylesterase